jgi:hypothetical protein
MNRRAAVWLAVVAVAAVGGVGAWRSGTFHTGSAPGTASDSAPPPATQPVLRRNLSQTTTVNATLGYAGSYSVTGRGSGMLTWLPSAGRVIRQGQVLYRVDNGIPVPLLYGSVPDWRALSEGDTART